jgi:hypothetical protein
MLIINPLEQFKILILQYIWIFQDISITNNTIILFFISLIFFIIFYVNYDFNSYLITSW